MTSPLARPASVVTLAEHGTGPGTSTEAEHAAATCELTDSLSRTFRTQL